MIQNIDHQELHYLVSWLYIIIKNNRCIKRIIKIFLNPCFILNIFTHIASNVVHRTMYRYSKWRVMVESMDWNIFNPEGRAAKIIVSYVLCMDWLRITVIAENIIVADLNWPGVGVTKPNSSVPLFSHFCRIIKIPLTYWISRWYLTGVTAARLRWYLSNMNVIRII